MKLTMFSVFLFTTTVQAKISPLSVVIHSEDPALHPANACDGESNSLEEELEIVVGHRVVEVLGSTGSGRKLESAFCASLCSYFPSRAWCWAYTPMCARESGDYRRSLENTKVITDHSLDCARTVLAVRVLSCRGGVDRSKFSLCD